MFWQSQACLVRTAIIPHVLFVFCRDAKSSTERSVVKDTKVFQISKITPRGCLPLPLIITFWSCSKSNQKHIEKSSYGSLPLACAFTERKNARPTRTAVLRTASGCWLYREAHPLRSTVRKRPVTRPNPQIGAAGGC